MSADTKEAVPWRTAWLEALDYAPLSQEARTAVRTSDWTHPALEAEGWVHRGRPAFPRWWLNRMPQTLPQALR